MDLLYDLIARLDAWAQEPDNALILLPFLIIGPFCLTLFHELGHVVAARLVGVDAGALVVVGTGRPQLRLRTRGTVVDLSFRGESGRVQFDHQGITAAQLAVTALGGPLADLTVAGLNWLAAGRVGLSIAWPLQTLAAMGALGALWSLWPHRGTRGQSDGALVRLAWDVARGRSQSEPAAPSRPPSIPPPASSPTTRPAIQPVVRWPFALVIAAAVVFPLAFGEFNMAVSVALLFGFAYWAQTNP